jgi:hypothetical protein
MCYLLICPCLASSHLTSQCCPPECFSFRQVIRRSVVAQAIFMYFLGFRMDYSFFSDFLECRCAIKNDTGSDRSRG